MTPITLHMKINRNPRKKCKGKKRLPVYKYINSDNFVLNSNEGKHHLKIKQMHYIHIKLFLSFTMFAAVIL